MPTARSVLPPHRLPRRMLRPPVVLVFALLLTGLSGLPALAQDAAPATQGEGGVSMSRGNPARTGTQPGPAPEGDPVLRWEFATGSAVRSSPAVVDGAVYVGSKDGHVYAVDAASGAERWRFATGGPVVASPAVADGMVLVGSFDGFFYALDAGTGERRWSFRLWATGSPTVSDGVVYVASDRSRTLHALDAKTGLEKWHAAFSFFVSEPAVSGQSVYVGADGLIQAFDKTTGLLRWLHDVEGDVFVSPVVGNGRVYAVVGESSVGQVSLDVEEEEEEEEDEPPSADENSDGGGAGAGAVATTLIALDTETGDNRWTYAFGADRASFSALALADGVLLAASPRGWLYAVDANTGQQLWGHQMDGFIAASPVVATGQVVVGTFDGRLHGLDLQTGELTWRYQSAPIASSAAVLDGVVYVGTDAGSLIALAGSNSPAQGDASA